MSTLSIEPYRMPSASMGTDSPLPDIRQRTELHSTIPVDETTVTPQEAQYMGWGRVNGILPYKIRDGYNRVKKMHAWKAVVLRNDALQATFLPQLGGRLWSLIDRTTGQELLHCNPVFQPCNLALRNAWISGGVEWNVGIIGHTPFTVDPMHTQVLSLDDGTPVLRMYQYERIRHLVYRVDALLPDNSRHLIVRVRIDNAGAEDTAVYWWSNAAINEGADVRVIVPAPSTFRYGYGGKLSKVAIPMYNDWDVSYSMQIPHSMDFFFNLPPAQRRWISALNRDGYGYVQTSTDVLKGRKLFVWGMGAGGRNWQTFLSEPGCAYIELQAGLASTQLEHLPMPGNSTIQWTEAYGAIHTDPQVVHGNDWQAAVDCVGKALEGDLPRATLDDWDARLAAETDGKTGRFILYGDGWGYVESCIGGENFHAAGLRFPPRSAGKAEREWLSLLHGEGLPAPDPLLLPAGYQVSDRWMSLLSTSIREGTSDHWYGWYQLGVMHAYRNEREQAADAFARSLAHARSPWALRCLAVLAQDRGEKALAADLMEEAIEMLPQRQLAIEALGMMLDAERYASVERVIQGLPQGIRRLGRIKAYRIRALLMLGQLEQAERMLRGKFELIDVREGEVSLTDLWFQLCMLKIAEAENVPVDDALRTRVEQAYPPPPHLDFRMH